MRPDSTRNSREAARKPFNDAKVFRRPPPSRGDAATKVQPPSIGSIRDLRVPAKQRDFEKR